MRIAFVIVWHRLEDYVVQPLVYGKRCAPTDRDDGVCVHRGVAIRNPRRLLAIPTAAAIQIVLLDSWANRKRETPSSTKTASQ